MSDEPIPYGTISLDEARRKKRKKENVPSLVQDGGGVVRRAHGLRKHCRHLRVDVDERARVVECRGCGVAVDPIDALLVIARHWESFIQAHQEKSRLEESCRELRAEEKRIKARVRRARAKGGER